MYQNELGLKPLLKIVVKSSLQINIGKPFEKIAIKSSLDFRK